MAEPRAVLEEVAGRFGGAARDTILLENGGKHLHELGLLLDPAPGSVLDVGGGLGVNLLCLRELLGPDARLALVDSLQEYDGENRMGPAARGVALLREADVGVYRRDFYPDPDLPAEGAPWDVVTIFDVLEHLPGHPLALLEACGRVLAPGGRLLLGGPNAVALGRRLKLLRGVHPYAPYEHWMADAYHGHYREYTPEEYRDLLERAGFRVDSVGRVAEPTATRARNRWHDRRHPALSPTALALRGMWALETLMPRLRPAVYCLARWEGA